MFLNNAHWTSLCSNSEHAHKVDNLIIIWLCNIPAVLHNSLKFS